MIKTFKSKNNVFIKTVLSLFVANCLVMSAYSAENDKISVDAEQVNRTIEQTQNIIDNNKETIDAVKADAKAKAKEQFKTETPIPNPKGEFYTKAELEQIYKDQKIAEKLPYNYYVISMDKIDILEDGGLKGHAIASKTYVELPLLARIQIESTLLKQAEKSYCKTVKKPNHKLGKVRYLIVQIVDENEKTIKEVTLKPQMCE